MNERIKELLEQAGVKYVTMPKDTVYEKFAELIVSECVGIVENQGKFSRYDTLAKKIKKHFGVEQ
jgi:Fe2+ or Zn2+ uptake regulation protein